jgi:prevent-host-death family protein
MRATSVRELHIHTSKLVHEAAAGDVIIIQRRGQPIAELRPLSESRMSARKKAQIFRSMEKFWKRMPQLGDSTRILEDDRNR